MIVGRSRAVRNVALGLSIVLVAVLAGAGSAFAEGVPFWSVQQAVGPRYVAPGGEAVLIVTATNLGDAPAEGASVPVRLTDALPEGWTATSAEVLAATLGGGECTTVPLVCTFSGTLPAFEPLKMIIRATAGAAGSLTNRVSVTGGGARSVTVSNPVSVASQSVDFGIEDFALQAFNEDGSLATQAGAHPFELTSTLQLNEALSVLAGSEEEGAISQPVGMAKDLRFLLPAGLVGNPQAVPQCTERQFTTRVGKANACPDDTVVGVASATVAGFLSSRETTWTIPVYNLAPDVGEPARFAFEISLASVRVYLDTSVRTGGDYGVTVSVSNISQLVGFAGSQVTFWGVPGDPRHDASRGGNCLMSGLLGDGLHACGEQPQHSTVPFLTLPTSCEGLWQTTMQADSWAEPSKSLEASYTLQDTAHEAIGMDGCNRPPFEPSISVAPDGQAASTPTGLTVGLHVPQQAALNPTGISEADVRNTTVTLPEGMVLNPAAADGLLACSMGQVGFERIEAETNLFTPGGVSCPENSKVGTVKIDTPLLPDPLEGAVYLAAQDQNPFGSLLALYIVAEDPTAGVLVKLAGEVVPDPVTGQLVSTFKNTPQLPFEDLHLKFFGTARAPLSTPALCGSYTTTASIAPWSGNPPATPSSTFDVTSGPNGGPCSNPLPFAPSLAAGTTNINAGAFTPLTTTISREDGNQDIQTVQLHMPPGLSGLLSGVKLCDEAQANAGTCGPESLIGSTIVSVGLGGDPFTVTGGQVFITGPYKGAPFGLSIVNPAKAGPFDLGKVVVRAKIEVDPHTAQLTITTDGSGPYAIPHMLDGIPLQIKHVNVTIDRPGFTFNPTNCNPTAITGAIGSVGGANAPASVPFQVTNCAALKFAPKFSVSTSAKTSKANGSSLTAKVTEPAGALGTQANITKVKVDLPIQLPSRLTTLQKACVDKVFDANPAGCPPQSIVGHAKVITPLLPVPLTGPAYFVSHGNEAFPSLTIVLQGYGVTVDLVGTTFINRAGITSTTFKTVPDVPFNTFELTLPQGKFSALGANLPAKANSSFCGQNLKMPTLFVAQNGLELHQQTPITVTGCPKAKKATRAQRLAAALKACRKKPTGKRAACAREARRRYGAAARSHRSTRKR